MRSSLIAMIAIVVTLFGLASCKEENHPEAENLAALISEEIQAYKSAQSDCENAQTVLQAFYGDPARHEHAAQAALAIIRKDYQEDEDYRRVSIQLIKPSFNRLGGVIFDFNSRCQIDSDFLDALKLSAGQKIKQAIDAQDIGAVSRLYQMEGDLREFIMSGLHVYDPEVEARLANLQKHRAEKEAREKVSGGLKMMDKLINTADKLVPPDNPEAKTRMKASKEAWEIQKTIIKSMADRKK